MRNGTTASAKIDFTVSYTGVARNFDWGMGGLFGKKLLLFW